MRPLEIVAELGVNHNGSLLTGMHLIEGAYHAGADTVKFQASVPGEETSRRLAPEHHDMIASLVPTPGMLQEWKTEAERLGLRFLCTPADPVSLDMLVRHLKVDRIKIASDNLTNPVMLKAVAATGLPIILSTGMGTMGDVEWAVVGLMEHGVPPTRLTILHCTSAYPCAVADAHLNAMRALRTRARLPVGWSDHTTSVFLPAVAVGLGAIMIEKHLTLDRDAPGPDHCASLEPHQFAIMAHACQEARAALGLWGKQRLPAETETWKVAAKSVVATRAILPGEAFREDNIGMKRPAGGLHGRQYPLLLGRGAVRSYLADEQISEQELP